MPRSYSKLRYYTATNSQLTLPAGNQSVVVGFNVPRMGRIHKIVVKQTGGANIAFTFNLYDYNPQAGTTPAPEFMRVINEISVASGGVGVFSSDIGTPFVNPDNKLYAVISLGSPAAANLSFDLAVLWQTND